MNVPGAVGDLLQYTFTMQANSVSDTVGNFTPAGPITTQSNPLLPVYADSNIQQSSEEGDLTSRDAILSGEMGARYQFGFNAPAYFRFSLSSAQSLNLDVNSIYTNASLWQDTNGNLKLETSERISPASPGYYPTLQPGQNYYIMLQANAGGPLFSTVWCMRHSPMLERQ